MTTSKKNSTTTNTTKFDSLKIVQNGLILKHGEKQTSEILFSELDKLYIKVYQSRYRDASILVPVSLAFLYIEYAQLDIIMFMAIFLLISFLVKTNYFRRYALVIGIKEGILFRKNISLKTKCNHVELLNAIKRAIQNDADTKKNFQFGTNQKLAFSNFPINDKRLSAF